jgi:hypothetical protein
MISYGRQVSVDTTYITILQTHKNERYVSLCWHSAIFRSVTQQPLNNQMCHTPRDALI